LNFYTKRVSFSQNASICSQNEQNPTRRKRRLNDSAHNMVGVQLRLASVYVLFSTNVSSFHNTPLKLPTLKNRFSEIRLSAKTLSRRDESTVLISPKPDTSNASIYLSYPSAIKILRAYKKEHGNLAIPRHYVLPSLSIYPSKCHSLPLASTVYNMKWWQLHISSHSSRVEELNDLGFLWERLQPEWNLVVEALISFRVLHRNTLVPNAFVVPHDDHNYPSATWGIPLGRCVHQIRIRHDFIRKKPDRVSQLNGLGFVWELSEHHFQKFVWALKVYRSIEVGELDKCRKVLRVPLQFVVPCESTSNGWPEDLHGYNLGSKCAAVRQKEVYIKNRPERRQILKDLGFWFGGNGTLGWLDVMHAAAIYSKMHERKLAVPTGFVVPSPYARNCTGATDQVYCNGDWPWPEQLWGLPLGQRLRDVRLKGRYLTGSSAASRISQLNALGFEWKPKRGRRKRHLGGTSENV